MSRALSSLIGALALLIIASVVVAVVHSRDDSDGEPDLVRAGEVRPGRDTVVESDDGRVVVEIPGDAIESPGTLTIEPAVGADDRTGWDIELVGTDLVGEATIRFALSDLVDGEPAPLVRSADDVDGPTEVVAGVTLEGEQAIVRTNHFSFWSVTRWKDVLSSVTSRLGRSIDAAASITADRAPRCDGEQAIRQAGYDVTSDSGRRVYWCLGLEEDVPTLKVVNSRGYGVVTEYSPGAGLSQRDRGGLIDIVADILTPPPKQRGNTTTLLASGGTMEFALDPAVPRAGVQLRPDPGAYLLSALQFGVETYTMVFKDVTGKDGVAGTLLKVLEGEQCLVALADLATSELTTPQEATEFFSTALRVSFDCVAIAAQEIDLGFINSVLVAPILWLASGVKTAADGIVAAADTLDVTGYQIRVTHTVAPEIDQAAVESLLVPAETCGDGTFGWQHEEAIQLAGGQGENFDGDFGAGILETKLIGAVDYTGDGADEAVLIVTCTGSRLELCCAGRTSLLDYVVVLDLSGVDPRRVGGTIVPIDVPGPNGYDEPRSFFGNEPFLDGETVVTYQTLVYPEQLDPAEVGALEGEVRYGLQGSEWVPAA